MVNLNILPVNFDPPPKISNYQDALAYSTEKLKHWIMAPKNAGILHQENIPFSFTMDGLKKKTDFRKNLIDMIENHNLTKEAALAALTSAPAKILGLENKIGKIKNGFLANIFITNGDYFNKNSKIESVWILGKEKQLLENIWQSGKAP